tara:strand:- start:8814 stop:9314 length:501 start_codon:yes stop_codon:yes gene_type:complete
MILTIWRHGAAEDGVNDHLRELTIAGREDVSFGCTQFHHACERKTLPLPTTVLHSPLVRTTQTAQIISSTFNPVMVSVEKALRPESNLAALDMLISEFSHDNSNEHIVLVSHQPLVSYLVAHYLGGAGSVPSLVPGGLVTLSLDISAPACGTLLFWSFPPEYGVGV